MEWILINYTEIYRGQQDMGKEEKLSINDLYPGRIYLWHSGDERTRDMDGKIFKTSAIGQDINKTFGEQDPKWNIGTYKYFEYCDEFGIFLDGTGGDPNKYPQALNSSIMLLTKKDYFTPVSPDELPPSKKEREAMTTNGNGFISWTSYEIELIVWALILCVPASIFKERILAFLMIFIIFGYKIAKSKSERKRAYRIEKGWEKNEWKI
jgi:hypothetical protein